MSGVQMLTVADGEGDQRLDRWLRKRFPHLTQGAIEKMCRKGELRVDGARATSASRVQDGQAVRVPPLPDVDQQAPPASRLARGDEAMIQAAVMWKDEHIIALNKPPGLASQGGSGQGDRHVDGLTPR
jgi:23S rRNA pseudouridine955/2504/2580 synthase